MVVGKTFNSLQANDFTVGRYGNSIESSKTQNFKIT